EARASGHVDRAVAGRGADLFGERAFGLGACHDNGAAGRQQATCEVCEALGRPAPTTYGAGVQADVATGHQPGLLAEALRLMTVSSLDGEVEFIAQERRTDALGQCQEAKWLW